MRGARMLLLCAAATGALAVPATGEATGEAAARGR
jgi:hypothetical protein